MGAAETKAGHEEEYADGTSAAPWPQLDGVKPNTSPSLVDDDRRSEDGEGRGGAKYNTITIAFSLHSESPPFSL